MRFCAGAAVGCRIVRRPREAVTMPWNVMDAEHVFFG